MIMAGDRNSDYFKKKMPGYFCDLHYSETGEPFSIEKKSDDEFFIYFFAPDKDANPVVFKKCSLKALYEVLLGWGYWEVEGNDLFEELGIETLEERIGAIIMAKMPGTYLGWIDPEHNSIWHSPGPAHSLCFSIKKENSTWIILQGSDSNHYDLAGAGQTLEDCVAIDEFATFKRQNGTFVFDDLSFYSELVWIANQLKKLGGNTFNCIANDLEEQLSHLDK
jgi:hypothetical protein